MNIFWSPTITLVWISSTRKSRIMSHHQLGEHAIQLVVPWHRQRRLHGLQGEVLPQPVGDLRVIAAVKTAEDEGEATAATAAAFPRSHGCPMGPPGQVGRVGGSFRASLQPPPPQSLASVRECCGHGDGTQWVFNTKQNPVSHSGEKFELFKPAFTKMNYISRIFSERDEQ